MVLKIGAAYNAAGTATILNSGDNYFLPAGIHVNANTGVQIFGNNHILTVEGVITAAVAGVSIDPPTTQNGVSITVGTTGVVACQDDYAISTLAAESTITNHGLILGEGGVFGRKATLTNSGRILAELTAIEAGTITKNSGQIVSYSDVALSWDNLSGELTNSGTIDAKTYALEFQGAATTLKLNNSGTITSDDRVVYTYNGATVLAVNSGTITANGIAFSTGSGARIELTNTGTITSTTTLSFFGDSGIDKVTNKGTMKGDVSLYTNNDVYEGNGGRVIGTVFGGSGNDKLSGGAFADKFDGGANDDTITGRGGKDTLTGGTGLDKFIFNTAPKTTTNKDTITDFSVTDDAIHLSKAITQGAGTLQAKFYRESTSGVARDADDRIIYETDTGIIRYDSNGSAAGGDIQVIAVLANKAAIGTTLSNADFIIF